jgi:DNA modification methylase
VEKSKPSKRGDAPEWVKLAGLVPDARNANKGTARGAAMIAGSLEKYGAGRSILIDRKGRIIAGNKTAEQAGAAGMEDVIVVRTDGRQLVAVQRTDLDLEDDPRAKELAIADNRAAQVSLEWDAQVLEAMAGEIDLGAFWNEEELAELLQPAATELAGDEDEVPEPPAEPVTKLGDLYELGGHRLLCGDATDAAALERLMGGEKADMVFTDPPYGIDYRDTKGKHRKIAGDQTPEDAVSLLALLLTNTCPMFICCNWRSYSAFEAAMIAAEREPKACIVWDKKVRVPNLDKFYKQHEFIVYYGPFGGQKTVDGDVWRCDREVSSEHPTAKPIELVSRALNYASMPKQVVLDLFGGSGSTLIACEKTGRRCRMMELDPRYCDVIVSRWELATGKKAVLL